MTKERNDIIKDNLDEIKEDINQKLFNELKKFWSKNSKSIKDYYYYQSNGYDIFNIIDHNEKEILYFYLDIIQILNSNIFNVNILIRILIYMNNIDYAQCDSSYRDDFYEMFKPLKHFTTQDYFNLLDNYNELNDFIKFLN